MRNPAITEVEPKIEAALFALYRYARMDAPYDLHQTRLFWMETELPKEMYACVAKLLVKRKGRGRRAWMARNKIIVGAIDYVAKRFALDELRNEASQYKDLNESACSIVHKALVRLGVELKEPTVNGIWKDRNCHVSAPAEVRGVTIGRIVQP